MLRFQLSGSNVNVNMHGSKAPMKNHKNIGFLSNTISHENSQSYQASIVGPLLAGGQMMSRLKRYLGPLSPHQLNKYLINEKKCPSWTPSDKFF